MQASLTDIGVVANRSAPQSGYIQDEFSQLPSNSSILTYQSSDPADFEVEPSAQMQNILCTRTQSAPVPVMRIMQTYVQAPVAPYRAFGDAVSECRQQRLMKHGSADEHTYVSSSEAGDVQAPVAPYRAFGDAVSEWRQQRLMKRGSQTEESEGEEMAAAMEAVRVE